MYDFLHWLLSDKKDGVLFTCFGVWHWCYIIAAFLLGIFALRYLKNKNEACRQKTITFFIDLVFCFYISDYFLRPLAFGEIDIENLPFHLCTSTCVACFISRHNKRLYEYRAHFALLGFVSNFVYLIYPAGIMWYRVHPFCYRALSTLVFHSIMAVYGLLVLAYENNGFTKKLVRRDFFTTLCAILWALLGSYCFNGINGNYNYRYNWFFVVRDPFYILPLEISRFVMPVLNLVLFFSVQLLVRFVAFRLKNKIAK